MFQQDADLQYHVNRIYDQLADADRTLPVELKAAVHKEMAAIDGRLEAMTADDGHVEFALDYISREAEAWRDDDLDQDEQRDDPPCTCGDRWCDVKWGRLPKEVKEAPTLEVGTRRFHQSHDGRPNVLFEARDAYHDERGDLMAVVRKCRIALTNRVHPGEIEEWGEMSPEEYAERLEGSTDGEGEAAD